MANKNIDKAKGRAKEAVGAVSGSGTAKGLPGLTRRGATRRRVAAAAARR